MPPAKNALSNSTNKYKGLIFLLSNRPSYANALAECSQSNDQDFIAKTLLTISLTTGTTLQLVREMIEFELTKHKNAPQNIFRSNSLTSKVLGQYVRRVGKEYLKMVLGDDINELITSNIDLEIDPGKMRDPETAEETVKTNCEALRSWCQRLLSKIMDRNIAERMPLEVRIVASYISQISEQLQLDTPVLVGGYIMLRFFNPAIATPEVFEIVQSGVTKSKDSQRNLILISKILQNLSNNITFGLKEQYMTAMNDFISENSAPMRNYLISLIDKETPSISSITVTMDQIDVTKFDQQDLCKFHQIVIENAPFIMSFIIDQSAKLNPIPNHDDVMNSFLEFVACIDSLGPLPSPPPTATITGPNPINCAPPPQGYPHGTAAAWTEFRDSVLEMAYQCVFTALSITGTSTLMHTTEISTNTIVNNVLSAVEKKGFLYEGLPTRDQKPVVYLVARRLTAALNNDLNATLLHILRVLRQFASTSFVMILDLAWLSITSEQRDDFREILDYILQTISTNIQKNMVEVLMVHSITKNDTLLPIVQSFIKQAKCGSGSGSATSSSTASIAAGNSSGASTGSGSGSSSNTTNTSSNAGSGGSVGSSGAVAPTKRKIREIEHWTQLYDIFESNKLRLPIESRFARPYSYEVVKVNSKGRHQERVIRVTPKSLINLELKNKHGYIKNERLLCEIEEISAPPASLEIHMRFQPPRPKSVVGYFPAEKSATEDLLFRRYICPSQEDRQRLMTDIFETTVRSQSVQTLQAFHVIKVNNKGKHQDRIFKLTNDSILNIDKRTIKTEYPFLSIDYAKLAPNSTDTVVFQMKGEDEVRCVITPQFRELLASINEGIARCKAEITQLQRAQLSLAQNKDHNLCGFIQNHS